MGAEGMGDRAEHPPGAGASLGPSPVALLVAAIRTGAWRGMEEEGGCSVPIKTNRKRVWRKGQCGPA